MSVVLAMRRGGYHGFAHAGKASLLPGNDTGFQPLTEEC